MKERRERREETKERGMLIKGCEAVINRPDGQTAKSWKDEIGIERTVFDYHLVWALYFLQEN